MLEAESAQRHRGFAGQRAHPIDIRRVLTGATGGGGPLGVELWICQLGLPVRFACWPIMPNPVRAEADWTQAPTFDCPTLGGCYFSPTNGFKVIPLGHMKSARWVNLESAPTLAYL